jgi:hypothetical protein
VKFLRDNISSNDFDKPKVVNDMPVVPD